MTGQSGSAADLLEHIAQVRLGAKYFQSDIPMAEFYDPAGLDKAEKLLREGNAEGGRAALEQAFSRSREKRTMDGFRDAIEKRSGKK